MFPGGGLAIVEGKRGLGTAHLPFVFFLIAPSVLMGACATSFPRTWNTKLYNYSLKCYYVSLLRRYHSKRYETQISIFITRDVVSTKYKGFVRIMKVFVL